MFNRTKIKQYMITRNVDKDRTIDDFSEIYLFSNEKLNEYSEIYDFDNARVMSVVGSGDQYFTSMLNGAKEVELFDINKAAWDYFRLKFYAMQILSYEEFMDFFYDCRLIDECSEELQMRGKEICARLMNYIPSDLQKTLSDYVFKYMNTLCSFGILQKAPYKVGYFSEENYYKLQQIIRNSKLPNFHNINILNLWKVMEGRYDLMLFSNIINYLEMSYEEYKEYLQTFKCPQIQVSYEWYVKSLKNFKIRGYEEIGFQVALLDDELVVSLKRSKNEKNKHKK